ncbi:hypothetical protein AAHA92_21298 [Salvia divinorum]|uniref:Uncharacterized protein n=1 Tax=Salvia divinorum TaxID=28513 RepID=A0ABD1GK07_SALDI
MLFCSTPKYFNKVVSSFNSKQKKAVVELGFGSLLNLQLYYMPGKLAFWLASYYNPLKGTLPLFAGDGEHIDEEDVHLTLGFPRDGYTQKVDITLALMFSLWHATWTG